MPEGPIVSVVMPVFNGQDYLDYSIQSILNQTESRLEFIIIDDGSTDSSAAVVQRWQENDCRIRLLSVPRGGTAVACNEGIRIAKGRFVARMDADDIAIVDRLERQIAYLEMHPDTVAVGGAYVELLQDGSLGPKHSWALRWKPNLNAMDGVIGMPHPTAMIRIDALRFVGGYRPAFVSAQDADLWLRLSSEGHIDNLEDVVLLYRRHSTQVSALRAVEQALCRGVAVAMSIARSGQGEPDWDPSEALTAPKVIAIAGISKPMVAAFLYAVLIDYFTKRGDFESSRKYASMLCRSYPEIMKIPLTRSLVRRFVLSSVLAGQFALPARLVLAAPSGWFRSIVRAIWRKVNMAARSSVSKREQISP